MRDGFTRFLIFLVIFVAGFAAVAVTDSERIAFDDAGIRTRSFLHTVCRMGEVSQAGYTSFVNSLPHAGKAFGVNMSCLHMKKGDTHPVYIGNDRIREEVMSKKSCEFNIGDEITIELTCGERSFFCRGTVNGLRRKNLGL